MCFSVLNDKAHLLPIRRGNEPEFCTDRFAGHGLSKSAALLARLTPLSGALCFISPSQFCPNSAGIARTMEKPKHNNFVIFYPEVNGLWKSPKQTTPKFSIHLWVKQWIPRNFTSTSIKHSEEFFAKSWCLLFVPCITGNDIFLHFGKEAYGKCHFLLSILP